MATLVAIERWGEGTDVDALSNPSFVPSRFARQDLDVVFAEVMLSVGCVLHNGRLVDAWGRLGGGEMLRIARCLYYYNSAISITGNRRRIFGCFLGWFFFWMLFRMFSYI